MTIEPGVEAGFAGGAGLQLGDAYYYRVELHAVGTDTESKTITSQNSLSEFLSTCQIKFRE